MLMTRARSFDTDFLVQATGGAALGAPGGARVETDSRLELSGALFVAIRGPRFDGHDFVAEAFQKGAAGAIVSGAWWGAGRSGITNVLLVDETLEALHALARAHRARRPAPLAAVTGSNGKTTTKELLALALTPLGPVLKTEGNQNNHIGLPLTILRLGPEHRAAAVEIGLNHPGELRVLSGIARPQVGAITNVAASHLEGLGSVDGVARAKVEIADGLSPDGVLVTPWGSAPLERALEDYRGRRRTFGLTQEADLHPSRVVDRGARGIEIDFPEGVQVCIPLLGTHAALNVLAALAAATALGIPLDEAAPPLEHVRSTPGRLSPRTIGTVLLLDDTYNANPGSLSAALEVLRNLPVSGKRWAILGDMLELGPEAAALHERAGRDAAFLDGLIVVGELARSLGRGARHAGLVAGALHEAASAEDAAKFAAARMASGDVILVKGSRGMHLEKAVECLATELGKGD
jgi:UDP-N-acetylmuramoyl-tripeptide--D-alanyl-D-alanine ligase